LINFSFDYNFSLENLANEATNDNNIKNLDTDVKSFDNLLLNLDRERVKIPIFY